VALCPLLKTTATYVARYRIGEQIRDRVSAEAKVRQKEAGERHGRGMSEIASAHVSGSYKGGETNEKIAGAT
jgi:hypothetical protein